MFARRLLPIGFQSKRLFSSKLEGIRSQLIKPEQRSVVVDYFTEIFPTTEPSLRALNIKDNAVFIPLFEDVFDTSIKTPSNFVFLDKKDNIIACELNSVVDFNSSILPPPPPPGRYDKRLEKLIEYLELIEKDLPKLMPDIKRWFKHELVSVLPEYRNMGLATKLWELAFKACRDLKCEGMYSEVTALASQMGLIDKMGFKCIYTLYHKDYLDENGKQIFNCDDGTDCGKLIVDNILYVNTKKTRQNGLTIICKIGDFELAKDVAKVYIGDMLTTPIHVAYSAPEVLKGKNMSRKSDIWMLGVCFWQILMYGQIPWSFFTTPAQLFDAICNKREVLLPPENTPEELADILRTCFEFDPKKRPTVEYVLKKLRSYKKYLKTNMGMASWMGQEDPNESKHCPTLQPAEDIYSSKTLCYTETVQPELNSVDGDDTNDDDDDDDEENIEDLNQSFTETSSSVEQQSVV